MPEYDIVRIRKPDYSKIDYSTLLKRYTKDQENLDAYRQKITSPEYLPWEKARFIEPPAGFTTEEAWFLTRAFNISAIEIPVHTPEGKNFTWQRLGYTDQFLNTFDMYMGGQFLTSRVRLTATEQQSFLTRGIIEEAIASSQLEGANVTRKKAKEMIAENRTPRDKDEWMAYNNYRMMTKLSEVYKDVPLSLELLCEIHQIVSEHTMDTNDIGRLRTNADEITIGNLTQTTYVAPDEKFMASELQRMIAFANDDTPERFVHPIIKSIILHFWLAYLHPFTDGNGRVARAIFYWYLLKKNYWLATYIPISTVIKRAPLQYSDAYIYSEQDNNDFTYFYDYHMRKIKQGLDDFIAYVERQQSENKQIDQLLDSRSRLNERQKQIMHYLLANPRHRVSMTSHSSLNNISLPTALSDLKGLQKAKLIFPFREGKFIYYYAKPLDNTA